nr:AbrB family transcriptional regulator [Aneurinibacillus terranovensis]
MQKPHFTKETKPVRFLVTLIAAFLGGLLFVALHIPIPWLLGSMASVFIGSKWSKLEFYWPGYIRDTGMIIVGYSIGLSFTYSALIQIVHQLPSMMFMTLILVSFCAVIALFVSKLSGVDYPTVLTGSIPGGLSQMITLAEEIKDIDLTTVTFLQVARLMMIIFFVPLLIFSPLFGGGKSGPSSGLVQTVSTQWDALFPSIIIFAIVSVVCAIIGKKVKLPTAYLLGPIIGTSALTISGFHGPVLPSLLLDISQFMIGGYIGLLLKPEKLNNKVKIISLAVISGMVMIIGSWGLSVLLIKMHGISSSTSFLSVAPGGMDQMGIIAHEVHADLSMVSAYQLFRIFFIYFVVPAMLKWLFKHHTRKRAESFGVEWHRARGGD